MVTLRIGQILSQRSLLSEAQVRAIVNNQVIFGARFGTVAVELGLLRIDELSQALAIQCGYPAAGASDMAHLPGEVAALVSAELCQRFGVFPLRLEGGSRLHLAMRDPRDLAQRDELSSILKLELVPHAVPELRLYYFLERQYGIARRKRYLRMRLTSEIAGLPPSEQRSYLDPLPAVVERPLELRAQPTPRPIAKAESVEFTVTVDTSPPAPERPRRPSRLSASPTPPPPPPPADEQRQVGEDDFVVTIEDRPRPPPRVTPGGGTRRAFAFSLPEIADEAPAIPSSNSVPAVQGIVEALARTDSPRAVTRLVTQPAISGARLALLLLVRGDVLIGLTASAGHSSARLDRVPDLVLELRADSLLGRAYVQRRALVARVDDDAAQQTISQLLNVPAAVEACAAPIVVDNQVVNLLCVQGNGDPMLPTDVVTQVARLADAAAAAYARLMGERHG